MKVTNWLNPIELSKIMLHNPECIMFPYTTKKEMCDYLQISDYKYTQFLKKVKGCIVEHPVKAYGKTNVILFLRIKPDKEEKIIDRYLYLYQQLGKADIYKLMKIEDYEHFDEMLNSCFADVNEDNMLTPEIFEKIV